MKNISYTAVFYAVFFVVWPASAWSLLADRPAAWEVVVVQGTLAVVMLATCLEFAPGRSLALPLSLLTLSVPAGIFLHALHYWNVGLVPTGSGEVVPTSWWDAVYFSIVTFTTLGYGDLVPNEEYRMVAAIQAVIGYLFLGALVGTLVAAFSIGTRTRQ